MSRYPWRVTSVFALAAALLVTCGSGGGTGTFGEGSALDPRRQDLKELVTRLALPDGTEDYAPGDVGLLRGDLYRAIVAGFMEEESPGGPRGLTPAELEPIWDNDLDELYECLFGSTDGNKTCPDPAEVQLTQALPALIAMEQRWGGAWADHTLEYSQLGRRDVVLTDASGRCDDGVGVCKKRGTLASVPEDKTFSNIIGSSSAFLCAAAAHTCDQQLLEDCAADLGERYETLRYAGDSEILSLKPYTIHALVTSALAAKAMESNWPNAAEIWRRLGQYHWSILFSTAQRGGHLANARARFGPGGFQANDTPPLLEMMSYYAEDPELAIPVDSATSLLPHLFGEGPHPAITSLAYSRPGPHVVTISQGVPEDVGDHFPQHVIPRGPVFANLIKVLMPGKGRQGSSSYMLGNSRVNDKQTVSSGTGIGCPGCTFPTGVAAYFYQPASETDTKEDGSGYGSIAESIPDDGRVEIPNYERIGVGDTFLTVWETNDRPSRLDSSPMDFTFEYVHGRIPDVSDPKIGGTVSPNWPALGASGWRTMELPGGRYLGFYLMTSGTLTEVANLADSVLEVAHWRYTLPDKACVVVVDSTSDSHATLADFDAALVARGAPSADWTASSGFARCVAPLDGGAAIALDYRTGAALPDPALRYSCAGSCPALGGDWSPHAISIQDLFPSDGSLVSSPRISRPPGLWLRVENPNGEDLNLAAPPPPVASDATGCVGVPTLEIADASTLVVTTDQGVVPTDSVIPVEIMGGGSTTAVTCSLQMQCGAQSIGSVSEVQGGPANATISWDNVELCAQGEHLGVMVCEDPGVSPNRVYKNLRLVVQAPAGSIWGPNPDMLGVPFGVNPAELQGFGYPMTTDLLQQGEGWEFNPSGNCPDPPSPIFDADGWPNAGGTDCVYTLRNLHGQKLLSDQKVVGGDYPLGRHDPGLYVLKHIPGQGAGEVDCGFDGSLVGGSFLDLSAANPERECDVQAATRTTEGVLWSVRNPPGGRFFWIARPGGSEVGAPVRYCASGGGCLLNRDLDYAADVDPGNPNATHVIDSRTTDRLRWYRGLRMGPQWNQTFQIQSAPWDTSPSTLAWGADAPARVPMEVQIAFANQLLANGTPGVTPRAYFQIPVNHCSSDPAVTAFLTMIRDRLDPGIVADVSCGNEVWNSSTAYSWQQTCFQTGQACDEGQFDWRHNFAIRMAEIDDLAATVFGAEKANRFHLIVEIQHANPAAFGADLMRYDTGVSGPGDTLESRGVGYATGTYPGKDPALTSNGGGGDEPTRILEMLSLRQSFATAIGRIKRWFSDEGDGAGMTDRNRDLPAVRAVANTRMTIYEGTPAHWGSPGLVAVGPAEDTGRCAWNGSTFCKEPVCIDGWNEGNRCRNDGDCLGDGGRCGASGYQCAGGANDGQWCDPAVGCPGGTCTTETLGACDGFPDKTCMFSPNQDPIITEGVEAWTKDPQTATVLEEIWRSYFANGYEFIYLFEELAASSKNSIWATVHYPGDVQSAREVALQAIAASPPVVDGTVQTIVISPALSNQSGFLVVTSGGLPASGTASATVTFGSDPGGIYDYQCQLEDWVGDAPGWATLSGDPSKAIQRPLVAGAEPTLSISWTIPSVTSAVDLVCHRRSAAPAPSGGGVEEVRQTLDVVVPSPVVNLPGVESRFNELCSTDPNILGCAVAYRGTLSEPMQGNDLPTWQTGPSGGHDYSDSPSETEWTGSDGAGSHGYDTNPGNEVQSGPISVVPPGGSPLLNVYRTTLGGINVSINEDLCDSGALGATPARICVRFYRSQPATNPTGCINHKLIHWGIDGNDNAIQIAGYVAGNPELTGGITLDAQGGAYTPPVGFEDLEPPGGRIESCISGAICGRGDIDFESYVVDLSDGSSHTHSGGTLTESCRDDNAQGGCCPACSSPNTGADYAENNLWGDCNETQDRNFFLETNYEMVAAWSVDLGQTIGAAYEMEGGREDNAILCGDFADNDNDGLTDCEDPDCPRGLCEGSEARCIQIDNGPGTCVCSEPLNVADALSSEPDRYWDPSDTTARECDGERGTGEFVTMTSTYASDATAMVRPNDVGLPFPSGWNGHVYRGPIGGVQHAHMSDVLGVQNETVCQRTYKRYTPGTRVTDVDEPYPEQRIKVFTQSSNSGLGLSRFDFQFWTGGVWDLSSVNAAYDAPDVTVGSVVNAQELCSDTGWCRIETCADHNGTSLNQRAYVYSLATLQEQSFANDAGTGPAVYSYDNELTGIMGLGQDIDDVTKNQFWTHAIQVRVPYDPTFRIGAAYEIEPPP